MVSFYILEIIHFWGFNLKGNVSEADPASVYTGIEGRHFEILYAPGWSSNQKLTTEGGQN
jgi:hypothetical protein